MKYIWYNPDLDVYQKGTFNKYEELSASSMNYDRYDILYEFPESSECLMDKILSSLNLVRKQTLVSN